MTVSRPLSCVDTTIRTLSEKKLRVTGAGNVRIMDMLHQNLPEMNAVKVAARAAKSNLPIKKVCFEKKKAVMLPQDSDNSEVSTKKKDKSPKKLNSSYFTPVSLAKISKMLANDKRNDMYYSRQSLMEDDTCFDRQTKIRKRSESPTKV